MRCLSRAGGGPPHARGLRRDRDDGENEDALEKVRNGLRLLPCV